VTGQKPDSTKSERSPRSRGKLACASTARGMEDRRAGRTGPNGGGSCPTAHLRHPVEQGRDSAPDGTSRNAPFQDRLDDDRLHRSEALGCSGGDGSLAGTTAGDWYTTGSRRPKCNGHRRFDPLPVCTRVCTNYQQNVHAGVNSGYGDQQKGGSRGSRGHRPKCLSRQKKRPADNACHRVFYARATGIEPATTGSTIQ